MTDTRVSEQKEMKAAYDKVKEGFGSWAVHLDYSSFCNGWQARAERETPGGEMRKCLRRVVDYLMRKNNQYGVIPEEKALISEAERILSQTGEKATTKPKGDRND